MLGPSFQRSFPRASLRLTAVVTGAALLALAGPARAAGVSV